MNCEAYIVESDRLETKFFPANVDTSRIREMCMAVTEDDTLVIRRFGSVIYYMYLRRLTDTPDKFVGLCVALNSVVIDNLLELYRFFNRRMRTLACNFNLAIYDKVSGTYHKCLKEPKLERARDELQTAFNAKFHAEETAPGAIDYTRHPHHEAVTIQANGEVSHFTTKESQHVTATVRQRIESGHTLIVTNELTDEQEIARLNKELERYKSICNQKQKTIDTLKSQISDYIQQSHAATINSEEPIAPTPMPQSAETTKEIPNHHTSQPQKLSKAKLLLIYTAWLVVPFFTCAFLFFFAINRIFKAYRYSDIPGISMYLYPTDIEMIVEYIISIILGVLLGAAIIKSKIPKLRTGILAAIGIILGFSFAVATINDYPSKNIILNISLISLLSGTLIYLLYYKFRFIKRNKDLQIRENAPFYKRNLNPKVFNITTISLIGVVALFGLVKFYQDHFIVTRENHYHYFGTYSGEIIPARYINILETLTELYAQNSYDHGFYSDSEAIRIIDKLRSQIDNLSSYEQRELGNSRYFSDAYSFVEYKKNWGYHPETEQSAGEDVYNNAIDWLIDLKSYLLRSVE